MRICKVCGKIVETLTQCLHLIIATLLKNPGHHVQKMWTMLLVLKICDHDRTP